MRSIYSCNSLLMEWLSICLIVMCVHLRFCFAQENVTVAVESAVTNETQSAPVQVQETLPEPVTVTSLQGVESVPQSAPIKKISLDVKSMDIVDLLKMLASRAGMNIIVGKNVKAQVSLFIRDVDIWDAFEITLLANGLAYSRVGGLINVMTQEDYQKQFGVPYKDNKEIESVRLRYLKAREAITSLSQLKSEVGKVVIDEVTNTLILMDTPERIEKMKKVITSMDLPLTTRVFELNYVDPEKLSDKIKGMVSQGVGSIRIDERTGKIAITDTPENLVEIEKMIRAFDEKPRQVLIDAQVIQLNPSDELQAGIDWGYWLNQYWKVAAPFAGVSGATKLSIGTLNATITKNGEYTAVIDALQTMGDTKILSSPRITVVDGHEARILAGTKEAYLTSSTTQVGDSASTTETVNFVDVGIKLYVTPQISREGFITLKIRPEVSTAEYQNFGTAADPKNIPIVTTSEAETTVVVNDGTTIVIGGLRKDEKTETINKIPIIGDIPWIGLLTRNVSRTIETTDLIILLTPHLVTGKEAITDFSALKPREGVDVSMDKKGNVIRKKHSAEED